MTFIYSALYLLLAFFSTNAAEGQHLWQQIEPLVTKQSGGKQNTPTAALRLCTANALSCYGTNHAAIDQEFLQTIKSLHIFSQLLPKLSCHNLQFGYFCLAKNICQISHEQKTLQTRQLLLKYFMQNSGIAEELDGLLASLKGAETGFLWSFYPQANKPSDDGLGEGSPLFAAADFYAKFRRKIDSNRYSSQCWQLSKISALGMAVMVSVGGLSNLKEYRNDTIKSWSNWLWPFNYNGFCPTLATKMVHAPGVPEVLTAFAMASLSATIVNLAGSIKQDFDDVYRKQKSLFHLRKLISVSQKISGLIAQNPELLEMMPELATVGSFASIDSRSINLHSTAMNQLCSLLNSKAFEGKPSYYISFQGQTIEAYNLYQDIRHEFVPLWESLGSLDGQLSAYKLIQGEGKHFCLPIWTDNVRPILHATNYWHPALDPQKAVKNCIALGGNSRPYNVIITGANAGGKTTALTSIMIAQILAQSIGIAPASHFFATPFARLNTYLDINTNLEASESLFMAQANRAQKLHESIVSCTAGQKSLTILDEIFTGTRADFAENASFEFAQTLGMIPHSICILATHFPKMTELEKMNLFVNYHAADAVINDDGTINYPYKIIPGISTQNIAQHILRRKGILK